MDDKSNVIPLKDVTHTELSQEEVLAKARELVRQKLETSDTFLLVSFNSEERAEIVAGCTDLEVMNAALVLATMVGQYHLGEAVDNMPPAIAQAVCLTTGLQQLNAFAREHAANLGAQLPGKPH